MILTAHVIIVLTGCMIIKSSKDLYGFNVLLFRYGMYDPWVSYG